MERKKSKSKAKKNISGLKKWNKIVSILVKDYKKSGESYDIRDVRALASSVYKDFKEKPLRQVKIKDVKESADKEITIEAIDVPNYWFDNQQNFTYWFQVGEWANRFANAYPTIPIMLITKATEKQPLVVQGATGDYDGSIFQKWTEDLRETLENPDKSDTEVGYFFGTPAYKNKKGEIYAVWFEDGVQIPAVPPKPTEIDPRKQLLIEKAEEEEVERRLIERPPKKRGRPKKDKTGEEEKKRPLKKIKPKKEVEIEKPQVNRVTEIRNLIDDLQKREDKLIELVKLKLISKSEFKKQQKQISDDISDLTRKLEKGGKI
jgi:hypothetical protein